MISYTLDTAAGRLSNVADAQRLPDEFARFLGFCFLDSLAEKIQLISISSCFSFFMRIVLSHCFKESNKGDLPRSINLFFFL